MTITSRFSTRACSLTHTTAMCCYQKGVNSIRVQRSLPGVTRNTRERTQNYTATFKFTNISIWWLLASFVFNYWKTLFRCAIHKLLLFPFWPAPFGKGFKLETLEQHSFARIFLPPPVPASNPEILLNSAKFSPNQPSFPFIFRWFLQSRVLKLWELAPEVIFCRWLQQEQEFNPCVTLGFMTYLHPQI